MKVKLLKHDRAFSNAHWNLVKTPQNSIIFNASTIFNSFTRRISPEKKMVVSMYCRLLRRKPITNNICLGWWFEFGLILILIAYNVSYRVTHLKNVQFLGKFWKVKNTHLPTMPRRKKKNPVNKNQRWEPIHQKYKANENTSRHNPKKNKRFSQIGLQIIYDKWKNLRILLY